MSVSSPGTALPLEGGLEAVAQVLRKRAGLSEEALPVDPLALAEALEAGVRPVGFGEQETLLVTLAPGILPPLQGVEASPGGTLLVSRELPPCRFRFAVAHGLAHLALGHLGEPPRGPTWLGARPFPTTPRRSGRPTPWRPPS